MKMKILGAVLMLVGLMVITVGIGVISSASDEGAEQVKVGADTEIKSGRYYLDGEAGNVNIEIFDDSTFSISGVERQPYVVRIWKDMPVTDEETGKITLTDRCFLGTNLDGGEDYRVKIEYDYLSGKLIYDGNAYSKL